MVESVGTFEAKTHLTRLIERVAKGERILITNRGKPVAMLVAPDIGLTTDSAEAGRAMLEYRDRVKRKLRGSFRELAHEGHRY
jgi:prevent-host-death family protein